VSTKRRAFVLGSGIAGLSLGEILSRNGYQVTLVDSARTLGGDASRCTQNWLHTGWLYAALPNRAAMLDCHRALHSFRRLYENVLPPDVVNVDVGDGRVAYPESASGWFAPERVHYLYALATSELSFVERFAWRRCLNSVAFPRLRALGYETSPLRNLPPRLAELLDRWEGDRQGHTRYSVVRSTDAQINTRRVLDTLLSLLGADAEVVRGADCALEPRGDRSIVRIDGERHAPDLVVVATGKTLPVQLERLGLRALARRFKSVSSPIVVLNRALDLPNFIRFTPRLPYTINHIKYEMRNAGPRSTIGSYDFYPDEVPDISPFANRVCKHLGVSTSDVASVYYGTKTELTGDAERRYNHALGRVNDNTYFAIAGKFSQFPLLVYELAALAGLRTDIGNAERGMLQAEVDPTAPERAVQTRSTARNRPAQGDARIDGARVLEHLTG
jgi:glycine/D-amino acid oxidase-like deaminating enzyme